MQKRLDLHEIYLIVENQFFSNQDDIQAISLTDNLVILTKFYKIWKEIVDFLIIAKL